MPDGLLVIDKPAGWTSMDVCAKLRGIYHEKRVGHAGTLDPLATGVLPVFVGQATKAVPFAENSWKEYRAALRLGVVTDTQDTSGTVLSEAPAAASEEALRALLPEFTGELEQVPPMYSAVKVQGKKLYELARRGVEVERAPRRITIETLELLGRAENGDWLLRVVCSKGTYIRTLCHDIGAALGCGGAMSALTRTAAAGFTLDEAVTLEQVQQRPEALLRPLDGLFRAYPAFCIPDAETERRCRCGNPLRANVENGTYRVYAPDGTFLALSQADNGVLTSIRNFFSK
ncbi:MAG: tRNA pseudouridine(55) synthase TruB [Ruminococcaceae bacterium]|jgi:tRNA pseudouridine55 synthase|nr:tRNA pseudouridine(55) synthase TruB [Oscillospiraceae bacterium]